mgnify:CR=1 FL=1
MLQKKQTRSADILGSVISIGSRPKYICRRASETRDSSVATVWRHSRLGAERYAVGVENFHLAVLFQDRLDFIGVADGDNCKLSGFKYLRATRCTSSALTAIIFAG